MTPRDREQEIRVRPPTVLALRCEACGRVYYSWAAHAEECVGPRQRVADSSVVGETCGCQPGFQHEPGCPEVTGYGDEAA